MSTPHFLPALNCLLHTTTSPEVAAIEHIELLPFDFAPNAHVNTEVLASMASTKRSLFSKPSWALSTSAPPTAKADDDGIFGRHGNKIYEDIVADELRRKERRAAKAKARGASEGRETKRRRISDENDDGTGSDADSSKDDYSRESKEEKLPKAGPVTRSTPTKKRSLAAALDSPVKPTITKPQQADTTIISLDGDGEDDVRIAATTTTSKTKAKEMPQKPVGEALESDLDSDDDDPYFRDLKRRTKEKELAQKQVTIGTRSQADLSIPAPGSPEVTQGSPSAPEGSPRKDEGPLVRILITSIYPNTKPLIVNQPASRSLKKVKEIWCHKQGFDEAKMKEFFLTWNGVRLFDSSNLMHTLEALKRQRPDEDDPSGGRIHLEAMNPQIMEHRQKQKEREAAEAAGPSDQGSRDKSTSEDPSQPAEAKFIIILRAKDLDPFKLSVRPSTPIFKIMAGYQMHFGIDKGKVCWLVFDGNRLEPNSTVKDAELEDDDVVEVHIR